MIIYYRTKKFQQKFLLGQIIKQESVLKYVSINL